MSVKSLLSLATVLCFGVVGCDDPEVEEKIADLFVYGAAVAEVQCTVELPLVNVNYTTIGRDITYKATKLVDGSCIVDYCYGTKNQPFHGLGNCSQRIIPKAQGGDVCRLRIVAGGYDTSSSYPFRQDLDGTHIYVQSGELIGELRSNGFTNPQSNCGSSQYPASCSDPLSWFTKDLSECTGRNLEAFGATP